MSSSREEFDKIDTDGDGTITAEELRKSLGDNPKISADHVAQIIALADDNGDQKLTFDEYEAFF